MLWAILIILVAFAGYIRFAPVNVAQFHVDPTTAETPNFPGHAMVSFEVDLSAPQTAQKLQDVILATPRTTLLAGDVSTDFASYTTRSAVWGFADIASVKVTAISEERAAVTIFSRLRHGYADMGVNAARVKDWQNQLVQP